MGSGSLGVFVFECAQIDPELRTAFGGRAVFNVGQNLDELLGMFAEFYTLIRYQQTDQAIALWANGFAIFPARKSALIDVEQFHELRRAQAEVFAKEADFFAAHGALVSDNGERDGMHQAVHIGDDWLDSAALVAFDEFDVFQSDWQADFIETVVPAQNVSLSAAAGAFFSFHRDLRSIEKMVMSSA